MPKQRLDDDDFPTYLIRRVRDKLGCPTFLVWGLFMLWNLWVLLIIVFFHAVWYVMHFCDATLRFVGFLAQDNDNDNDSVTEQRIMDRVASEEKEETLT